MSLKTHLKPTRIALLGLVLIGAFIGLFVWEILVPHCYESSGALTLAQAQGHSPIPLPASAQEIHIATFRHWQQYAQYVRFKAPVADCEAHALTLLPGTRPVPMDFTHESYGPPFNPSGAFHDLNPFDCRGIKNGVQYGTGGPSEPRVCIDKDRGEFFYCITD